MDNKFNDEIDFESLSLEEQDIQRNLYLRTFLTGERQGPPTGKASVDRPWLINYDVNEIASVIPKRRLYEDLIESNKANLNLTAIEYFGNRITYRELIDNIERVAYSFECLGVKKGDVVSVCMPYLPETIYTIYALNKIGAVINMIDPRINCDLITEYSENCNAKFAVIIDKVEEKINKILTNTGIEKVISVSPTNSMSNLILRNLGKLKNSRFIKWNDFVKKNYEKTEMAEFVEHDLAVIEYTSGTSGKPKGVMLSNESFNSLAYFQKQSLINNPGDKFLLIMPPFIAYGLVIGMHDMLCQGQNLIMIPNFTLDKAPKMLGELIDKHHPNYIMGVPNFLLILMNYKKDLSFLKGVIIGGDHLDKEIEKRARLFFDEYNSPAKVLKGWGMTEIASCGTFTKTDVLNNIGSVGIPLSKNLVKVLQRKSDGERYNIDEEELFYGQEGTLFVSSPAMTLGYYKNSESTDKIVYTDKDGRKWINSGDIFKIEKDGSLFFTSREKRVVVRPDGHNIPSSQIESIASSFEDVNSAIVIGTCSRKYTHGSVAALCVEFKDKLLDREAQIKLLKDIEKKCQLNLQPRDRAKYYVLIDNIPYTMNGKVDYIFLTKYVDSIIDNLGIDEEQQESFYIIDGDSVPLNKGKKKMLKK